MPGVLVDCSSSSPHTFYPFESGIFSNSCFDGNGGFDSNSVHCDLAPVNPHSSLSVQHFSPADVTCSSPPAASDRARDVAQRILPRSSLGLGLSNNVTDTSFECSSDLVGVPIPSPRKNFYSSSSTDSMVGSPIFADVNVGSPSFSDVFSALHKFLPSNSNDDEAWRADAFLAMDAYSCDDFRMYEFKVRRCMRGRSHDWTECPFAHPGEKARRRDPRRIHYSGTACPDFRKGSCKRGDACEFAHGVFECWLHPARYRTQPCKDGRACRRRVCFFAHTVEQLRVLPSASTAASPSASSPRKANYDGSPFRQALAGAIFTEGMNESIGTMEDRNISSPKLLQKFMEKGLSCSSYGVSSLSPTLHGYHSSSPPTLSPPFSPSTSPPMSPEQFACWSRGTSLQHHPQSPLSNAPVVPAHRRHLNRLQTMPTISVPSAAADNSVEATALEDSHSPFSLPASIQYSSHTSGVAELLHSLQALQLRTRVGDIQKVSSTPSSPHSQKFILPQSSPLRHCAYSSEPGTSSVDAMWELSEAALEAQPPLRVESGRNLRASIYAKIGKDNGVESNEDPDLGWVNELLK